MARAITVISIEADQYDRVRELIGDDPDLPASFELFVQRLNDQIADYTSRGIITKKVVINPDAFISFCRKSGRNHDSIMLRAFAVSIAETGK